MYKWSKNMAKREKILKFVKIQKHKNCNAGKKGAVEKNKRK